MWAQALLLPLAPSPPSPPPLGARRHFEKFAAVEELPGAYVGAEYQLLSSPSSSLRFNPIPNFYSNPGSSLGFRHVLLSSASPADESRLPLRVSANSSPKARFVARRNESVPVTELQRPLSEYMSLPASQYSVLDAERIERVDENTFRCYVYRFKFFAFEVCPILLVSVEEQPNGCCINLLFCKSVGRSKLSSQISSSPRTVSKSP